MLFTVQNHLFGTINHHKTTENVKLPADIDDDDIKTGTMVPFLSDLSLSPSSARPTQMTYLFSACRLYRLSDDIREFISTMGPEYSLEIFETELNTIRESCDTRYAQDYSQEPLPVHHQANKNILHTQIHHQLLLLHQPALVRFLQGEFSPETYTARAKCIASANTALSIFVDLVEDPNYLPYKWYTSGLGSLHAFYSIIVLSVLLFYPGSASDFDESKAVITKVLDMFALISVRSCSKAVPIMREIVSVIYSL
jgi:hypothetical protein